MSKKKQNKPVVFRGQIILSSNGETEVLHLLNTETWTTGVDPLADEIANRRWNKPFLSVKYYVSSWEIPEKEIQASYLKYLYGKNEAKYEMVYSEITGYLWTDEEIVVGGHDLLDELMTHLGKWLHMEITFYSEDELPDDMRKETENG
jgi:hypothetical protein